MPQVLVEARGPRDAESSLEVNSMAVPFNRHEDKHLVLYGIGQRLYERQRTPLAWFLI